MLALKHMLHARCEICQRKDSKRTSFAFVTRGQSKQTIGGEGGEIACDPNRESDFGFVFVYVSCVRAKLCAMILLWLGPAKLFLLLLLLLLLLWRADVPRRPVDKNYNS